MFRPVGEFVRQRGGFRIAEGLEGRHLHMVGSFSVVGACATVADLGAGRDKEPVGMLDALQRGEGRGLGRRCILRGKVFALLGVEDGVAFEERDFPLGLFARLIGLGAGGPTERCRWPAACSSRLWRRSLSGCARAKC